MALREASSSRNTKRQTEINKQHQKGDVALRYAPAAISSSPLPRILVPNECRPTRVPAMTLQKMSRIPPLAARRWESTKSQR